MFFDQQSTFAFLTLRSVVAVGEVEHLHARRLGRLAAGADDVAGGDPPLRRVGLPKVFLGLASQARLEETIFSSCRIFYYIQYRVRSIML